MQKKISISDISKLSNKIDLLALKIDSLSAYDDKTINQILGRITALEGLLNNNRSILNSKQAASYLGISMSNLYKLIRSNSIPFHKPSRKLYFDKSSLDKWISSNQ